MESEAAMCRHLHAEHPDRFPPGQRILGRRQLESVLAGDRWRGQSWSWRAPDGTKYAAALFTWGAIEFAKAEDLEEACEPEAMGSRGPDRGTDEPGSGLLDDDEEGESE
jgi:hypothetical protein